MFKGNKSCSLVNMRLRNLPVAGIAPDFAAGFCSPRGPHQPSITPPVYKGLQFLYLRGNLLQSLWDTQLTPSLIILDLSENELQSLDGVGGLEKLHQLYANSNAISQIDNLPTLSSLEILSLSCNRIASLAGMQRQPALEVLNLSDNALESIAGLPSLPSLQSLRLAGNPVASHATLRLAVLLAAAACGNRELWKVDGDAFTDAELERAAGLGWPQRLSALYGWIPRQIDRSYSESFQFLLSLQVQNAQWQRANSAVWLADIRMAGRAEEGEEVRAQFWWETTSKQQLQDAAAHAQAQVYESEKEALAWVARRLKEGLGAQGMVPLADAHWRARAKRVLEEAQWRLHSLPDEVRRALGGVGGEGARLLSKRHQAVCNAEAARQGVRSPRLEQHIQWYRVDDWGNTSELVGCTGKQYRVRGEDVGYTLKAECTCSALNWQGIGVTSPWQRVSGWSPVGSSEGGGESEGEISHHTALPEWETKVRAFGYTRRVLLCEPQVEEVEVEGECVEGCYLQLRLRCIKGSEDNLRIRWHREGVLQPDALAGLGARRGAIVPEGTEELESTQGQWQIELGSSEAGRYVWVEVRPLRSDGEEGDAVWARSAGQVQGRPKMFDARVLSRVQGSVGFASPTSLWSRAMSPEDGVSFGRGPPKLLLGSAVAVGGDEDMSDTEPLTTEETMTVSGSLGPTPVGSSAGERM